MNTESIKEKLHLHVKRRIQEQGCTVISNSTATSPSASSHSVGRKQQQVFQNNDTSEVQTIHPHNPTRSPKKNKARKYMPASIVDGESISCSSSSTQPPHEPPPIIATSVADPDTTIKTTNNNAVQQAHTELDDKCNTVLAIVLNEKKDSMMKDPAVIKCLRNIYNKNEAR